MKSFAFCKSRESRGSLLFVIFGILFAVFLVGGFFLKYMMSQHRASRRQSTAKLTTSIAYSLAMLAMQKIQNDIFPDPTQKLSEYLMKPFNSMGDLEKVKFDLGGGKYDLTGLADALLAPLAGMGNFSYELFYSCRKEDFSRIGPSEYCCEKAGLVHLTVIVTFKKSDSDALVEESKVASNVKVTAAFIPLLSKFNLFVQDSEVLSEPRRFNLVLTDQFGKLKPSSPAKPWELHNSSEELLSIPNDLDTFVKEPRGLIYFGGGKVILNLTRGWVSQGQLSEGFHLFGDGNRDGLYTIDWLGPSRQTALLAWDQGVCDEIAAPGANDWWKFISKHPKANSQNSYARASAVFRLLGSGNRKSPTLVLGEVYRGLISARAFKSTSSPPAYPPDFLDWKETVAEWRDYAIPPFQDNDEDNIGAFCLDAGLGIGADGLRKYQEKFSSKVAVQPYNLSLAFFQYLREASPIYHFDAEFQKKMIATSPIESFYDLPKPLQVSNIQNLKQTPLGEIISKNLQVPGPRTVKTINPIQEAKRGEVPNVLSCLQKHGLISRNSNGSGWNWILNGWVYVDSPDVPEGSKVDLEIKEIIRVESNGGLVLKRGNILIRSSILSDSGKVLQLVTLNKGDIIIETNGQVNAGLTAVKGAVRNRKYPARIFGAVAMDQFNISSASQGAELKYNPAFSINPAVGESAPSSGDCGEKPLLAASLEGAWVFLQ